MLLMMMMMMMMMMMEVVMMMMMMMDVIRVSCDNLVMSMMMMMFYHIGWNFAFLSGTVMLTSCYEVITFSITMRSCTQLSL